MSYYVTIDNILLHIIYYYLWCHVPVLCVSFLDPLDESGDELPYHIVVLPVSLLDSLDEFGDELPYRIVVLVPFFLDYPHEVVI